MGYLHTRERQSATAHRSAQWLCFLGAHVCMRICAHISYVHVAHDRAIFVCIRASIENAAAVLAVVRLLLGLCCAHRMLDDAGWI